MMANFPKSVFEAATQQLAATGRIGATRWFRTPSVGAVAAAGISIPAPIRFNQKGIVLAMYGQVASGVVADFAGTSVRIQVGGTEDLVLDGQGAPSFMPLLAAFGGVANWQPLMRRVIPGVDWIFTFRNDTAGNVTPMCVLAFLADVDVEQMAKK